MRTQRAAALTGLIAVAVSAGGLAHAGADNWILRVGGHHVEPKSTNHSVVNVDSAQSLTFSLTYVYSPHWSVELLGALPFKHDIHLNADGSRVASVKHLPPTLTVQYNFRPSAKVRPFVGVGANATIFFDESTRGALAGTDLSLDSSFGAAAELGMDVDISRNWFMSFDVRWIDIDTKAKLSGTDLGRVRIEPVTYGISFGHRFGR